MHDFRSLISRIQTIREHEKLKANQKPVAWEVRKSSPRKTNNLVNYSSSQFSEVQDYNKEINNYRDQSTIGFRDFNPGQNLENCFSKNFYEYNDEDSYFDEFDFDKTNK